uniref:Uncharacterized protein n=1 Tax=Meloidogyne enterolobii TaxID=390850 RepID=A0A6V7TWM6_MELEN|nr:unnamed protein product [Meloidogyne enterolobii]
MKKLGGEKKLKKNKKIFFSIFFSWHIYKQQLRASECRLVVFSEKDTRLLYDSATVVALADRFVFGSHLSQCGRFQFLPHKYDTLKIAKMLFGTMPGALKSDSLKIHTLKDSNSVMISRVFSVPKLGKYSSTPFKTNDIYKCMVGSLSSDSDNQSNYSTIRSLDGIAATATTATSNTTAQPKDEVDCLINNNNGGANTSSTFSSKNCTKFPVFISSSKSPPTTINNNNHTDPPENFVRVRNSSLQMETADVDDIMEELRAFSPNRLSRARRCQLSQIGLDESLSLRLTNRSRLSSCSSIADVCGGGIFNDAFTEWQQYGFAILLPVDFRSFVFQHILQIEQELDKLAIHIHKAVQDKTQFFQSIYEGWTSTCQSLCLLCNSLRLKNPVWQSLASAQYASVGMHKIASKFCSQLAQLICEFNTKETKFFLSTLLSAVLMNQLTWVASVAPPENYCCLNNNDGDDVDYSLLLEWFNSSFNNHQNNGNNNNNKINYYNPTVAQLLELYYGVGTTDSVLSVSGLEESGGEGRGNNNHNSSSTTTNNFCNNSQFTKIVVVGDKPEKIALLLRVLSYFVRCSSVESKRSYELLAECGTFKFNGEPPELHDFGRTLMAGVCNAYSPHFVLSGIQVQSPYLNNQQQQQQKLTSKSSFSKIITKTMSTSPPSQQQQFSNLLSIDSIFNTICEDVRHPTGEPCLNSQISALLNNSSSSNGSGCLSPTTTNTTTANTTTTNSLCIDHSNLLLMSKNNVENVGGGGVEARKFSIGQLGKGISGGSSGGVNGVSPSYVPAGAKATTSPKKHNNMNASNCCSTTPIMTKSSSLVIFIDMCNLDVRIITSDKCQVDDTRFVCPSDAVTSMLEEFAELYQYKCAPDFLLSFLEDHLVSLLDKSNVLVNLVKTTDINDPLPMEKVSSILGCDCSDLRLILNIAGVYSPDVLATAC